MSAAADFALYLEAAGTGEAARRAREQLGVSRFEALRGVWSGRLITPNTTPEEVETTLGPAHARDDCALWYRLPIRPDHAYVFEFAPSTGLLRRSGFRLAATPPAPPLVTDPGQYKQQLVELGVTAHELELWLGQPSAQYGWWPEEIWVYPNGLSIRLRHNLVVGDSD